MSNSNEVPLDECKRLIYSSATERDPAKRSKLSQELSLLLTKPGGLVNLVSSVIDFDTSSQKSTTHNQRFLAIAAIITRLPQICMPYKDYCQNLSKQLKPILKSENPLYSSLACIIVKALIESPHSTGGESVQIIIKPILLGLTQAESSYTPQESIVVIHNLLVNGLSPKHVLEVFPQQFYALVKLHETPSRLKNLIRTSLISVINDLKPGAACCLLEKTLFHDKNGINYLSTLINDDEITIEVLEEPQEIHDTSVATIPKIVLSLVEESNNEKLILEFFFHFQECMWNKDDEDARHLSATLLEPLLDDTVKEKSTKLDMSSIIATNQSLCLHLVHRTLLNYLMKIKHPQNNVDSKVNSKFEVQSIKTCLNILEVLRCLAQINSDNEFNQNNYRLILEEMKREVETKNPGSELVPDITEALNNFLSSTPQSERVSSFTHAKGEEISSILRDLNDKIVPVQVHALIRLKQMIMSNDTETVSRIPHLFTVIAPFLENQEPYVFLACIGLVSEMALRKTEYIMPKLIELHQRQDLEVQARLNMGEVLVRLLRQLNETAPKYAQQVVNSLIKSCRDEEELIRMSTLTNLGELCGHLKDSLGVYILDVLSMVELVLADDTIQVKTAAIDLLRTTLSRLDRLTIESIQKELKTVYKLLKTAKSRTLDEHLCLQADLALDEMDRIARELILGDHNKKLVKNLRVLTLD